METIEILEQLEPHDITQDCDVIYATWVEHNEFLKTESYIHFHIKDNEVTAMTSVFDNEQEYDVCHVSLDEMKKLLRYSEKELRNRLKQVVSIKRSFARLVTKLLDEGYDKPEDLMYKMLADNSLDGGIW